MLINFEDFIFEKMGINDEVIKLSEFVYKKIISDMNNYRKDNAEKVGNQGKESYPPVSPPLSYILIPPKNKYNIKKINIIFDNSIGFDPHTSIKNDDGVTLCFHFVLQKLSYLFDSFLRKNRMRIKEMITHEMNHGCDWIILNRETNHHNFNYKYFYVIKSHAPYLFWLLYYADEREMKSTLHEYYQFLNQRFKNKKNITLQDIEKSKESPTNSSNKTYKDVWGDYKKLINYNIRKDGDLIYWIAKYGENALLELFKKCINEELKSIKEIDKDDSEKISFNLPSLNKIQNRIRQSGEQLKNKMDKMNSLFIQNSKE